MREYILHIFAHTIKFYANDALSDDVCFFIYDNKTSATYNFARCRDDIRNAIRDAVSLNGFTSPWIKFECNSDRLFEIRELVALFFHPQIFFEDEGWEDFLRRPNVSQ